MSKHYCTVCNARSAHCFVAARLAALTNKALLHCHVRRVNPTAFAMGFSYFYSAEFIRHFRGPQRALLEWGEEE